MKLNSKMNCSGCNTTKAAQNLSHSVPLRTSLKSAQAFTGAAKKNVGNKLNKLA